MDDTTTCLKLCQLNCMRASAVMLDLGRYMCGESISVALVQEPYAVCGRVCGLPTGFRVLSSAVRENGYVSAAVVINDCALDVFVVDGFSTEYGVCVCVKGRNFLLYVASVYCKHGDDISPYIEYMEGVRRMCGNRCLVVGMDANAVSPMWYSKRRDRRHRSVNNDRALEEWIMHGDMNVLNRPSEWFTFCGPRGTSDIDVTVANRACDCMDFRWNVIPNACVSDHNIIRIDAVMDAALTVGVIERTRWVSDGVEWDAYVAALQEKVCGMVVFEGLNVNEKVIRLTEWIHRTNDEHMRRVKRTNVKRIKWWTNELDILRREVRMRRGEYQRARSVGDGVENLRMVYKECLRRYKNAMKLAKVEHWRNFVRMRGNEDVWGPVYKLCRGKKRVTDISSLKVGDRYTSDWNESVNVLLNEFFPTNEEPGSANADAGHSASELRPVEFDWCEINAAVYDTKVRRAPGLDGINGHMMKSVWRAIPEYVTCLYNQCLSSELFPSQWKVGDLVVLLKSPDKVRSDPRSYRPVCLLSVMSKVLERMLVRRMNERLTSSVSGSQFGFVSGKSTDDALVRMKDLVSSSSCHYVLGMFIDFRGAFDYIKWNRVIEKLYEIRCDEVGVWKSYFSERKACVSGVNETVWKAVERGCPQGSVAGPAVWNMMMNDLLIVLERVGCKIVAYADDLLLIVEGDSRSELERKGTDYMTYVRAWSDYAGVAVSLDKSVCMCLKGKFSGLHPPRVRFGEANLRYRKETKYLGVVVGEGMNFNSHVCSIRPRMLSVVNSFKRVLRKEWGLNRRTVLMLYKCLFVQCMAYGSSVWAGTVQGVRMRDEINRCQRIVMYAFMSVCRTVSTDAMQVLMGELPWDLEVKKKCVFYVLRKGIPLVGTYPVSSEEVRGLSLNEAKMLVEERMFDEWQNRWDVSVHGRTTYEFLPDVRFVRMNSYFDFGLSLGFLLTGHGSMNDFLFKRNLANVAGCLCGAPRETVAHLLTECVIYQDIRRLHGCEFAMNGGRMEVSSALSTIEGYESLKFLAVALFERRRELLLMAD